VRRVDVVVIGTGAMGASTAWHLARRGCSVLAVEQFQQGHTRGSSHGGVRIFRYTYPAPYYTALTQQALPWWRVLEDEAAETLLDLNGVYDHGRPDLLAPLADSLQACGVPHEWLTPDEAQARVPGLRFDTAVLHHASGGRTFAHATVQALVRLARHHGAEVRFECPATLRVVGDHVEVDLGDEVVWARRAVVTAGAWVGSVLAQDVLPADVTLPQFVVTEEQLAHYAPHDPEAVWPSFMHHTDRFRYGLFTPGEGLKVGGLVNSGQTGSLARIHQVTGDFGLAIGRDHLAAGELGHVNRVPLVFEHQFDGVVHGAFFADAAPHACFVQQIHRDLLQDAGANATQHILAALALQNDVVNAGAVQQCAQQEPGGAGANDGNLRFQ